MTVIINLGFGGTQLALGKDLTLSLMCLFKASYFYPMLREVRSGAVSLSSPCDRVGGDAFLFLAYVWELSACPDAR